ncbi:MAG: hypothetical protein OHK0023_03560 [Anaerolineae bacterium]
MTSASKKKLRNSTLGRTIRLVGVLLFVFVFVVAAFPVSQPTATIPEITLTAAQSAPPVPAGGTAVNQNGTYFHPSGAFSAPRLIGWELPAETENSAPEEMLMPVGESLVSRAGATFINSAAESVAHLFVEQDPRREQETTAALTDYYTPARIQEAYNLYNGGSQELNRGLQGDWFVVNTAMQHEGRRYLGRQISRIEGTWLMVARLVVPDNNPQLLDRLQGIYQDQYRLWRSSLAAPLDWTTLVDDSAGYIIRYPRLWTQEDGARGAPYTISGDMGAFRYRLVTRRVDTNAPQTEAEARTWVETAFPRAQIQSVRPEERERATGFTLSFLASDADGNQRSSVITLLDAPRGGVVTALLQIQSSGRDLLKAEADLGDLTLLLRTFNVVDVPLPPTPTPLPSATPTPAG